MKSWTVPVFGVVTIAGIFAAAVTGIASAQSSGVIHGCVNTTASRVIDHVFTSTTPTCPAGEFGINWNTAAPPEPPTAGPAGLDVMTVSTNIPLETNTGAADAMCPSSHPYVLSGGVSITSENAAFINTSQPLTGGWAAQIGWPNASPTSATVYAVCSK